MVVLVDCLDVDDVFDEVWYIYVLSFDVICKFVIFVIIIEDLGVICDYVV